MLKMTIVETKKGLFVTGLFLAFSVLAIVVAVSLVRKPQITNTSADAPQLSLSLNSQVSTADIGQEFIVAVAIANSGQKISGAELTFRTSDYNKLKILSVATSDFLPLLPDPNNLNQPHPLAVRIGQNGEFASIIVSAPCDANGCTPNGNSGIIASLRVKAVQAGQVSLSLDTNLTNNAVCVRQTRFPKLPPSASPAVFWTRPMFRV